ncbi:MAG: hypothetical protein MRJ52_06260 [Nitrosomonas sp.]|nr:hypothetical protein [Nitrosomonas sp.]
MLETTKQGQKPRLVKSGGNSSLDGTHVDWGNVVKGGKWFSLYDKTDRKS